MLGPPTGMRAHAAAGRPAPTEAQRPGGSSLTPKAPSLQMQVPCRQGNCCKGTLVYQAHACTCKHCPSLEADTATMHMHEGFPAPLYVHIQQRTCPGRRQPCLQHFHSCTQQLHLLWKRLSNQQPAPKMPRPTAHSGRARIQWQQADLVLLPTLGGVFTSTMHNMPPHRFLVKRVPRYGTAPRLVLACAKGTSRGMHRDTVQRTTAQV